MGEILGQLLRADSLLPGGGCRQCSEKMFLRLQGLVLKEERTCYGDKVTGSNPHWDDALVALLPELLSALKALKRNCAAMGNSGSSQGSPNTAAIDELINSHDMVVFSSSTCPFCSKALAALREAGYTPKVVESFDRGALSAKCGGSTSVPKVFVKQNFIGGCNDGGMGGALPLLKNGKIKELMGN